MEEFGEGGLGLVVEGEDQLVVLRVVKPEDVLLVPDVLLKKFSAVPRRRRSLLREQLSGKGVHLWAVPGHMLWEPEEDLVILDLMEVEPAEVQG